MSFSVVAVAAEAGEGLLVFKDQRLVAVLVRLSAAHREQEGSWFLEAGIGAYADPLSPTFPDLEAARAWFENDRTA